MNISSHAKLRYVQRYVELKDGETAKGYLSKNGDRVTEWINKEFEHAQRFYSGQMKGKQSVNYYILVGPNHLYITDTDDNSIVTTYPVEFGFSEEIDQRVVQMVIDELVEHQSKTKETREANEQTLSELREKLTEYEEKVNQLEHKLKSAKEDVTLVNGLINSSIKENTDNNKEEQNLAYKLVNSRYYIEEVQSKNL